MTFYAPESKILVGINSKTDEINKAYDTNNDQN